MAPPLDVYGVFRPLRHVARVLALTPVPQDSGASPRSSPCEVLYRAGVLTALSAWFVATSVWSVRNFYPRFSSDVVLAHMLEALCLAATAFSSVLLGTTLHRRKLTTVVRTLDRVIRGAGGDGSNFLSRARSVAVVDVTAAGCAMAALYLADSWHWARSVFFPPFLMGYVIGFVNLVMHTQFTTALLLVRDAFRALNAYMLRDPNHSEDRLLLPRHARRPSRKQFVHRTGGTISFWVERSSEPSDQPGFVPRKPPFVSVDGGSLPFGSKRSNPLRYCSSEDEESALALSLCVGHADLRECVSLLEQAFGVPVLLQLSAVTVGLVWCLYAVFVAVLRLPGSTLPSFAATSVYACRVVVHVGSLVSLCSYCSAACGQGNRTAFLLQSRLLDGAPHHGLRAFSHQLLHCRLQVMACGLFPINYRLVYVVLASVLTYLVLLLQFESRTPQKQGISSCTGNFTNG